MPPASGPPLDAVAAALCLPPAWPVPAAPRALPCEAVGPPVGPVEVCLVVASGETPPELSVCWCACWSSAHLCLEPPSQRRQQRRHPRPPPQQHHPACSRNPVRQCHLPVHLVRVPVRVCLWDSLGGPARPLASRVPVPRQQPGWSASSSGRGVPFPSMCLSRHLVRAHCMAMFAPDLLSP